MVNRIYCATQNCLESVKIEIEATFSRGLPHFNITGLVSNSIKESQHRVTSALLNNHVEFPPLKLNINLSPSDLPKSGSHFDLPIALLVIATKDKISTDEWFAFGELGLNGDVKSTSIIYPLLLDISIKNEHAKVILPSDNRDVYEKIPNLRFYFVDNIRDCMKVIKGDGVESSPVSCFDFNHIGVMDYVFYYSDAFEDDFADIKGQRFAIRAALIAVSGFHNIIFEGSPGCGKSMIAKRMQYILPPMSLNDIMECMKIQSFCGLRVEYAPVRPFRDPHHSASRSSVLGSANQHVAKPGEIALANNGMIFLDELPYFDRSIIESLREPLENNRLSISRVHSKIIYDTNFLFVGAMNPCPCGNLLSSHKECRCKDSDIARYKQRLSEPFLDRMDLFVQMDESHEDRSYFSSKDMREIVFCAFRRQVMRNGLSNKGGVMFNSKLSENDVDRLFILDSSCSDILHRAVTRFGLSHRSRSRIKRLSRTIADINDRENITDSDVLDALGYRRSM